MSLLDRMLKAGAGNSQADIMSQSTVFTDRDVTPTKLPILNVALGGELAGGVSAGLTILAGVSKTFKSALTLYCMKAYLDKHSDVIGIFYDTEMGITNDYMQQFGIDTDRVVHITVDHVEQLKFDMTKKLDEIKRGDRVFFMIDSIGQISSKKEVDDAVDEKSVADMTRAKALRSFFRLVTIQLAKKNLPCIAVNHVYQTQEMFSKTVVGGGTAVMYSANTILIISKSQEKGSDGDLEGWNFNITVEKSRFVREKSKVSFLVDYEKGINLYSGILDLAIEGGFVIKPKNGWYQLVDKSTGEVLSGNVRAKDTENKEFLGKVLTNPEFNTFVKSQFKLQSNLNTSIEEDMEAV